jgi:hypothetical protein
MCSQAGSLWVAWVKQNWLKRRSSWHIPLPKACSWSWKRILKLRDVAKEFLSFKVGKGHDISLWFDAWHPAGRLVDTYGFWIVYDSGISIDAKLADVLQNDNWIWPPARSEALVDIQSQLPGITIGADDVPVWKSIRGIYSCSETWNSLRNKAPKVPWWKVVWFPLAIPRHAFVLWLVCRNALTTKERMCGWGFTGNSLCRFCFGCQESIDHLFFQCSFCRRVWRHLMADCFISNPCVHWDEVLVWSCNLKGKSQQTILCKLCLAATIYHLWRLRNDLCYGNTPLTEEALVARIKREVRTRVLSSRKLKNLSGSLAQQWRL